MEHLAVYLAVHGVVILILSLVAGLLLHKAIRFDRPVAPWHLAHAGTSGRGVMLLAMAAILGWVDLGPAALAAFARLILLFAWTSTLAMVIAAATNERGLTWAGSFVNKLVFALYVASALTAFPAAVLLLAGLLSRLRSL